MWSYVSRFGIPALLLGTGCTALPLAANADIATTTATSILPHTGPMLCVHGLCQPYSAFAQLSLPHSSMASVKPTLATTGLSLPSDDSERPSFGWFTKAQIDYICNIDGPLSPLCQMDHRLEGEPQKDIQAFAESATNNAIEYPSGRVHEGRGILNSTLVFPSWMSTPAGHRFPDIATITATKSITTAATGSPAVHAKKTTSHSHVTVAARASGVAFTSGDAYKAEVVRSTAAEENASDMSISVRTVSPTYTFSLTHSRAGLSQTWPQLVASAFETRQLWGEPAPAATTSLHSHSINTDGYDPICCIKRGHEDDNSARVSPTTFQIATSISTPPSPSDFRLNVSKKVAAKSTTAADGVALGITEWKFAQESHKPTAVSPTGARLAFMEASIKPSSYSYPPEMSSRLQIIQPFGDLSAAIPQARTPQPQHHHHSTVAASASARMAISVDDGAASIRPTVRTSHGGHAHASASAHTIGGFLSAGLGPRAPAIALVPTSISKQSLQEPTLLSQPREPEMATHSAPHNTSVSFSRSAQASASASTGRSASHSHFIDMSGLARAINPLILTMIENQNMEIMSLAPRRSETPLVFEITGSTAVRTPQLPGVLEDGFLEISSTKMSTTTSISMQTLTLVTATGPKSLSSMTTTTEAPVSNAATTTISQLASTATLIATEASTPTTVTTETSPSTPSTKYTSVAVSTTTEASGSTSSTTDASASTSSTSPALGSTSMSIETQSSSTASSHKPTATAVSPASDDNANDDDDDIDDGADDDDDADNDTEDDADENTNDDGKAPQSMLVVTSTQVVTATATDVVTLTPAHTRVRPFPTRAWPGIYGHGPVIVTTPLSEVATPEPSQTPPLIIVEGEYGFAYKK